MVRKALPGGRLQGPAVLLGDAVAQGTWSTQCSNAFNRWPRKRVHIDLACQIDRYPWPAHDSGTARGATQNLGLLSSREVHLAAACHGLAAAWRDASGCCIHVGQAPRGGPLPLGGGGGAPSGEHRARGRYEVADSSSCPACARRGTGARSRLLGRRQSQGGCTTRQTRGPSHEGPWAPPETRCARASSAFGRTACARSGAQVSPRACAWWPCCRRRGSSRAR